MTFYLYIANTGEIFEYKGSIFGILKLAVSKGSVVFLLREETFTKNLSRFIRRKVSYEELNKLADASIFICEDGFVIKAKSKSIYLPIRPVLIRFSEKIGIPYQVKAIISDELTSEEKEIDLLSDVKKLIEV